MIMETNNLAELEDRVCVKITSSCKTGKGKKQKSKKRGNESAGNEKEDAWKSAFATKKPPKKDKDRGASEKSEL